MNRIYLLSATLLTSLSGALINTYFSGQIHSIETILITGFIVAWAIEGEM